jgi:anti-sigma B factor antagonist
MIDTAKADNFSVFPTELRGDTLIVRPRGDATGFGVRELQAELDEVLIWIESPDIKSLIVDLGASNYYGSQIIGAINSLVLKSRETGGRSGVCEISGDMQEALEVMNLNKLWTIYESRQAAMADLMTETVAARFSASIRTRHTQILLAVGLLAIIILVALVVNFATSPTDDELSREAYKTLTQVELEMQKHRSENLPRTKWKLFAARSREKIEAILKQVERSGELDENLKEALGTAGREGLIPQLASRDEAFPKEKKIYREQMNAAKKLLEE